MPCNLCGKRSRARKQYQSIDDTIVQLFISRASVLMTRIDWIHRNPHNP